jgi:serine/threonine protein kinase
MLMGGDGIIRIIDFGLCLRVPFADPNNRNLATDVSENTSRRLMKAQGQSGKLEYMAPEVFMSADAFDGFAIDLWAAGIVLFELLVGKRPFAVPDPVDENFYTISVEGDRAWLLQQAKGIDLSDGAVDLLQKMLWCEPAKRLTLSQVVSHPWVRGGGSAKEVVTSAEEDGMYSKWFIKSKSIDDMNADAKLSKMLLTGLLDDTLSRSPTLGSMASTAGTSDADSQNLSSPGLPFSLQKPGGEAGAGVEHVSTKERSWLGFRLKLKRWWRAEVRV